MPHTNEHWRGVPGFEGAYEVSDQGRVRSITRGIVTKAGVRKVSKGKVLKFWVGSSGYFQVYLGRGNPKMVHHLVLTAFHGPRPEGKEGRHGNGKCLDNRAVNLSWSTHQENELDKQAHGTNWQRNKTHCPNNHPLREPNLVVPRLKRGFRLCKACNREYYSSRTQKRDFDASRADLHLEKILSNG